MRSVRLRALCLIGIAATALLLLVGLRQDDRTGAAQILRSPAPAGLAGLPGRSTLTPSGTILTLPPTVLITPAVTSPFAFPTRPPEISLTPADDCTSVFPIESVERIELGETTIPQLEAAFGRADSRGGRPPRLRFEADGCTLLVTIGVQEALEAELVSYGSLGWLLDRYGPPDAVGISQGNLTLLNVDSAVLLYPDEGILAIFEPGPDDLDRDTPISQLIFRLPYTADKQMTRLHLLPVEGWQPPLR